MTEADSVTRGCMLTSDAQDVLETQQNPGMLTSPSLSHVPSNMSSWKTKLSVGKTQVHRTVINDLADKPDALLLLVQLVPCQSILKEYCTAPQYKLLFSSHCCHMGAVS